MGEQSKIQWTDHTFNPWRGCTKVSPGCANCYAEAMSGRNPSVLGEWGPTGKRVVAAESYWKQPLAWNRQAAKDGVRRKVFCASLADIFEGPETMPAGSWGKVQEARERLFGSLEVGEGLIDRTPNLDWLLLTKRPENVSRILNQLGIPAWIDVARNVWLGVSVENQQAADDRIPHLLRANAAVRFLSCEPLLGPICLPLMGTLPREETGGNYEMVYSRIHWAIIGGESGPHARPLNIAWVRSLVKQCREAHVPCFVKQMGRSYYEDRPGGDRLRISLEDPKGGDPAEWPDDLRLRQFPEVAA